MKAKRRRRFAFIIYLYFAAIVYLGLQPFIHLAEGESLITISTVACALFLLFSLIVELRDLHCAHKFIYQSDNFPFVFNPIIGKIIDHFHRQRERVQYAINEAKRIGAGDLRIRKDDDDALQMALYHLAQQLGEAAQQAAQQRWGLSAAAEVNDLLRELNTSGSRWASPIISSVCKSLKASYGALFILEGTDDKMLKLEGAYAIDDYARWNQPIPVGHGVTGQVVIDMEPVILNDIPESYVRIGSGLGAHQAKCIVVAPLISQDQVFGVVEVAALAKLEEHEIQWLLKICEAIASGIRARQTTAQIKSLLMESEQNTLNLVKAQKETEVVRQKQIEEIRRLEHLHERNLRLVKEKAEEVEQAKQKIEELRRVESERSRKQTETQARIMQGALDKFKKREHELMLLLEQKDAELKVMELKMSQQKVNTQINQL